MSSLPGTDPLRCATMVIGNTLMMMLLKNINDDI